MKKRACKTCGRLSYIEKGRENCENCGIKIFLKLMAKPKKGTKKSGACK